jgi:hypothetical protein
MGSKEIMVEQGHYYTLASVGTAYRRMLETTADENLKWYASVIKNLKAWEDRPKQARLMEVRALDNLLHCLRRP